MIGTGSASARLTVTLFATLLLSLLAQGLSAPLPAGAVSPDGVHRSEISTARSEASAVSQQEQSNSSDVAEKALLTVGIAAAAGVIALIGYLIRKRIGFWPHRPQPEDHPSSEEPH